MVTKAEQVSAILGASALSEPGLQDRARGTMLGLAVGNLLGIPMEGRWYYEIDRYYPRGVLYIDKHEAHRRMDDDLAQAVELAEALAEDGDVAANLAARMVTWARENGRGMGSLTRRVIYELEGFLISLRGRPARLRKRPQGSQWWSDAVRTCGLGPARQP